MTDKGEGPDAAAAGTLTELELERKRAAGLDKKIGELQSRLREAEAVGRDQASADVAKEHADLARKLAERAGELSALEAGIVAREKALSYAIEKGLPISLTVGNAGRLEAFQGEVSALHDSILAGLKAEIGTRGVNAALYGTERPGAGLRLAHVRAMSNKEVARIPKPVLARLMGEAE